MAAVTKEALASMLVQVMGLAVASVQELVDHPIFVEARELVQDAAADARKGAPL